MRLPEFTAEASLGKVEESYILTSEAPAETGRVLPQQHHFVPACFWDCNDGFCGRVCVGTNVVGSGSGPLGYGVDKLLRPYPVL